jgi:purine-binding chemotaxis protein CheW
MSHSTVTPGHYLTFKVGKELFAIDVFQVREVLDLSPITRVPTSPPYLRGVVNVRGKAIPVVDMRYEFGLPAADDTVHTRIVVLEIALDGEVCVIGGQADSVHEVIEIEPSQVEPAPRLASRWRAGISRGLVRRGDDFVIVLDVDAVFAHATAEGLGLGGGEGDSVESAA